MGIFAPIMMQISGFAVDYLLVGGGGGGGNGNANNISGAGGGAGGFLAGSTSLASGSYPIVVGNGGACNANGTDTTAFGLTAVGGGSGGGSVAADPGGNGGSGGGGGGRSASGADVPGGTATAGQGNAGGIGRWYGCGGGGGAGAAGGIGSTGGTLVAGNGGDGLASSISGSSVTYAGGGGGGSNTAGTGGAGGGGAGSSAGGSTSGTPGTNGLGGGGGGTAGTGTGGIGGKGVAIAAYAGGIQASGGVITSSGGNTIHTFTANGTFSVPPVASATWTDATSSATDGTTFTFNSRAIGAASADRIVVVGVSAGQSGSTVRTCTVTIGGVTATQLVFVAKTSTNSTHVGLFALLVPTGTTGNIVLTFSGTQVRCGIDVWALTGTAGVVTPANTANNTAASTTAVSTTITTVAGGACIGMFGDAISGASQTTTWTGLTEDNDSVVELSVFSGAHLNGTAGGSLSISATESSTGAGLVLVAASW